MADALVSPAVGISMAALAAGVTAYSIKKVRKDREFESKIPLMGVVGAFVFAAQMINFTIPGTGSSGHIGGGVLLAAILGPEAGFLSILSILVIQCLFFGDGGILALGCNIINMGLFGTFIGYRLIYKRIISKGYSKKRIMISSILGVVIGLQLGAFSVVLETLASGITELPFTTFIAFMQPIHLAIGLVEGVITGLVLNFVYQNRPDILQKSETSKNLSMTKKKMVTTFLVAALVIGGIVSLFASSNPDGLEWSIFKTTGAEEIAATDSIHEDAGKIQDTTVVLPDYSFNISKPSESMEKVGTVVAGVVGVGITVALVAGIGYFIRKKKIS